MFVCGENPTGVGIKLYSEHATTVLVYSCRVGAAVFIFASPLTSGFVNDLLSGGMAEFLTTSSKWSPFSRALILRCSLNTIRFCLTVKPEFTCIRLNDNVVHSFNIWIKLKKKTFWLCHNSSTKRNQFSPPKTVLTYL